MIRIYEIYALTGSRLTTTAPPGPGDYYETHDTNFNNAYIQRISEIYDTQESLLRALVTEHKRKKESDGYKSFVQDLLITNGYNI